MVTSSSPLKRVLLVLDAPGEREMYAEWFRRLGACTLLAANADDGYRMAVELAPQVIIADVKLGPETGLSLAERLKREPQTGDIPIVILSGYGFANYDDATRLARCDLVVHKPCLPDALADEVIKLMLSARGQTGTTGTVPTSEVRSA